MRDASRAPRNSRNSRCATSSLLRVMWWNIWSITRWVVSGLLPLAEKTDLRDRCQYLLLKPDEQPQAAIKLRDPAPANYWTRLAARCTLACTPLVFLEIYREAWAWE